MNTLNICAYKLEFNINWMWAKNTHNIHTICISCPLVIVRKTAYKTTWQPLLVILNLFPYLKPTLFDNDTSYLYQRYRGQAVFTSTGPCKHLNKTSLTTCLSFYIFFIVNVYSTYCKLNHQVPFNLMLRTDWKIWQKRQEYGPELFWTSNLEVFLL